MSHTTQQPLRRSARIADFSAKVITPSTTPKKHVSPGAEINTNEDNQIMKCLKVLLVVTTQQPKQADKIQFLIALFHYLMTPAVVELVRRNKQLTPRLIKLKIKDLKYSNAHNQNPDAYLDSVLTMAEKVYSQ